MALVVSKPILNEVWTRGNEYEIQWTGSNTDYPKLYLYVFKGAVSSSIASITNTAANGTYSWTLPSTLVAGVDYKIRASESD